MRDLFAVFLQYTDTHQRQGLEVLRDIIRRAFPAFRPRIVVVDNALAEDERRELSENTVLLGGDNTCREFSGWDKGLEWIEKQFSPSPDSVLILANDTLVGDPNMHLFLALNGDDALRHIDAGRLLGYVDCLAIPAVVFGLPMRRWVKTNLFLCSWQVLERLRPLSLKKGDAELFAARPGLALRSSLQVSVRYGRLLADFLQGRPNELMWRWRSARPCTPEEEPFLRLKAKATLCEAFLGARARDAGIVLHDVVPRFPLTKGLRAQLRCMLFYSGAWQWLPTLRARFE